MLILYIKDNCAYSAAVIHKIEELGIPVDIRNVVQNRHAIELIERGGKFQVPYLFDLDWKISIYESGAILDYLDKFFARAKI